MARALRVVTVERGIDPRRYALVAFGGAGPMHAARLAEELEIDRIVCPPGAGVLSAVGLVVSSARRDHVRSVLLAESELERGAHVQAVAELAARARAELPDAGLEASYDLRYRGQAFELTVRGPLTAERSILRERFESAHRERYGYADEAAAIELVNVRVAAVSERPAQGLGAGSPGPPVERGTRPARFGGEGLEAVVLVGAPAAGTRIDGPAIVELPETTVVVPPGWRAESDASGAVVLERA
jgi:N-methylhydantoinase A